MAVAERSIDAQPQPGAAHAGALDTFPKLLLDNAHRFARRPAIREKDYGIWQSWTWAEVAEQIRDIALGFAALGLKRGDKVAVVGDNRPRLYWSLAAAQCLGAIPVPIYQDAVASEMEYVLDHAEVRFAVCEDQEQVDKVQSVRAGLPKLERLFFSDPRGMRHYSRDTLMALDELQEKGRAFGKAHPGHFAAEIARGRGSDVAIILYTSGTTGQPKGVMLTCDNIITMARSGIAFEGLTENEEVLAYLPMAWVGDNVFSIAQSYCTGFCVSCPESGATVMNDLRELGPTYFFAPPRIWENILTQVMIRMEDAGAVKRWLFDRFMKLARRVGGKILDGEKVGLGDRLLYRLGRLLVYGPLLNTLGFSRIRIAYTAGEAIGPDIFKFYRSLGVNIKQLYGMTECSVFLCIQPNGQVRPDTVGTPVGGVEIKIADDGEVLYRSPGVFAGYFKNPQATSDTKRPDGWTHSGDAGFFDDMHHLHIIDRAKDVGKLQDGTLFAPKFIENKLKFFPYIREAVAFEPDRPYVTAFINIDAEAVGNWAERNGITYGGYMELARNERVYELIRGCVEQVNSDLAQEPHLAGSQIRRFLILHKELDADDGELTRTRKVRRRFIAQRYQPLVDALFGGQERARIATEVVFEDGRKGTLQAELRICDAKTFPVPAIVEPLRRAS